ncbi:MAG: hypothetical protein ACOC3Z_02510 [Nanoarchaeota archaeon]
MGIFSEKNKYYTSMPFDDKPIKFEDQEVIDFLENEYSFEIAYIPKNHDIACLLEYEDANDTFNDKWKIVFFKKELATQENDILTTENITLDNMDQLINAKEEYKTYKVLEGNFGDVVKITLELISKHESGENQSEAETIDGSYQSNSV